MTFNECTSFVIVFCAEFDIRFFYNYYKYSQVYREGECTQVLRTMSLKSWFIKRKVKKLVTYLWALCFALMAMTLVITAVILGQISTLPFTETNDNVYDDCDTTTNGILWLSFCGGSILFGIMGCCCIVIKKKLTPLFYLIAMLLCISALLSWLMSNTDCWDSNFSSNDTTMQASIIIIIIASLCWCCALCVSSLRKSRKGGYTLMVNQK